MSGASRRRTATALIAALLCCAAIVGVAAAWGDIAGGANVRATFDGWITPRALPRSHSTPVTLHFKGKLTTTDHREPPPLKRLTISINRNGKVSTVGLPTCSRRVLRATTTTQALNRCRDALVGTGVFKAKVLIPEQSPFPARGRVMAFNARLQHGRRALLAHVFGTTPLPTSTVVPLLYQRHARGAFGTSLSIELPNVGADWGHITGFDLKLHRLYRYRGRTRSFVSASCPAPRGFSEASFAAARGTYFLGDGRKLTRVLRSSCKVSG